MTNCGVAWICAVAWIGFVGILQSAAGQLVTWEQSAGPYGGPVVALHEVNSEIRLAATSGTDHSSGALFYSEVADPPWRVTLRDELVFTSDVSFASMAPEVVAATTTFGTGSIKGRIYSSNDFGASWTRLADVGFVVRDIHFVNEFELVAATDEGLFRSTDDGASWKGAWLDQMSTWSLTSRKDTLYVGTDSGVFRIDARGPEFLGLDSVSVRALEYAGNALVAGGPQGVFRSLNGGKTFEWLNGVVDVEDLAIESDSRVWAGSQHGLFREDSGLWSTVDTSHGWVKEVVLTDLGPLAATARGVVSSSETTRLVGVPNTTPYTLARFGDGLLAGTELGLSKSQDHGDTWTSLGIDEHWVTALAATDSILFVGTRQFGGVLKSADGGDTWTEFGLDDQVDITSLVVAESTLFAGTSVSVFASELESPSWSEIRSGIEGSFGNEVRLLADGTVAVANSTGIYFLDDNAVVKWQSQLRSSGVWFVDIMSTNRAVYAASGDAVYRSDDDGVTWQAVLSDRVFTSLASTPSVVFVGTQYDGVLWSRDDGATWETSEGLPVPSGISGAVVSLLVEDESYLFAGLESLGVFRLRDPVSLMTTVTQRRKFSLSAYPNPFSSSLHWIAELDRPSSFRIRLYDSVGRVIAVVADREYVSAGAYRDNYEIGDLAAGVYFLHLTTDFDRITRPVLHVP